MVNLSQHIDASSKLPLCYVSETCSGIFFKLGNTRDTCFYFQCCNILSVRVLGKALGRYVTAGMSCPWKVCRYVNVVSANSVDNADIVNSVNDFNRHQQFELCLVSIYKCSEADQLRERKTIKDREYGNIIGSRNI